HAMVEYSDGSVIAQISATDMRMPIQYALTYPERSQAPVPKVDWSQARRWEFVVFGNVKVPAPCLAPVPKIDWSQARRWDFDVPEYNKFPLLRLAYRCLETGGSATCTLNAADEVAVEAFLERKIGFQSISQVVEETLSRLPNRQPRSIGDI